MSIQVMEIFNKSFKNVRTHSMEWIRVGFVPFMIWIFGYLFMIAMYASDGQLSQLTGGLVGEQAEVQEITFSIILGNAVYYIAYLIGMFNLYINGFRYGVLQEGGDQWWNLNFNMRFLKMILYTLLIGFLSAIYVGAAIGIGYAIQTFTDLTVLTVIAGILLVIGGIYALIRLSLTFTLISIDQNQPIRKSWRLLKGNVLRLFGLNLLIALVVILIALAGFIVIGLFAGLFVFISSWLAMLLIIPGALFVLFIWFLSWALQSKALSLVLLSFTEGQAF